MKYTSKDLQRFLRTIVTLKAEQERTIDTNRYETLSNVIMWNREQSQKAASFLKTEIQK